MDMSSYRMGWAGSVNLILQDDPPKPTTKKPERPCRMVWRKDYLKEEDARLTKLLDAPVEAAKKVEPSDSVKIEKGIEIPAGSVLPDGLILPVDLNRPAMVFREYVQAGNGLNGGGTRSTDKTVESPSLETYLVEPPVESFQWYQSGVVDSTQKLSMSVSDSTMPNSTVDSLIVNKADPVQNLGHQIGFSLKFREQEAKDFRRWKVLFQGKPPELAQPMDEHGADFQIRRYDENGKFLEIVARQRCSAADTE